MMRTVLVPVLVAASLMTSTPAMAYLNEWHYSETIDPFTDEIVDVYAFTATRDGSGPIPGLVGIKCEDKELTILLHFEGAEVELIEPARIKWRVNKGKLMEFMVEISFGAFLGVSPPVSIEMARSLIQARHLVASNGGDAVLELENLSGGENVERVLKTCGH